MSEEVFGLNKVIVSTTASAPTDAIRRYDALVDWRLIVVTDARTPPGYTLDRGIIVTPAMQEEYDRELSDLIGWNCIQRRNFGFLWARDLGADIVAVVDDDNVPADDWGTDLVVGEEVEAFWYDTGDLPVFDPVGATNESAYWHRGFPLQLVSRRDYSRVTRRAVRADIQAGFWNGAADLDAVCRLIYSPSCEFDPARFPIASNAIAPFNTQNTFLRADVLPDFFVFPHIGRMDDIWAAFYVQSLGRSVVFTRPTVFHARSERNLTEDMRREYLGYEQSLDLVRDLLEDPTRIRRYLPPRAAAAFDRYRTHFA